MNFKILDFEIGVDRTFVIAEIGNNHNGSVERAKEMIDKAVEMGADCAKFQMRHFKRFTVQKAWKKVVKILEQSI